MERLALDRVREMEDRFGRLKAALDAGQTLDAALWEDVRVLCAYMEGGLWLCDYERDERGELPENMKRGVLSQDALYDLLSELDGRMKEDAERGYGR